MTPDTTKDTVRRLEVIHYMLEVFGYYATRVSAFMNKEDCHVSKVADEHSERLYLLMCFSKFYEYEFSGYQSSIESNPFRSLLKLEYAFCESIY